MPITPEFVAEARRVYIPAVAWWKAQGGNKWVYRGSFGGATEFESKDKATSVTFDRRTTGRGEEYDEMAAIAPGLLVHDITHPLSLAQAIDYLVTARILPGPMHSLMQVHAETARFEAEGRDGGRLIFGDVAGFSPARRGGKDLWLDLEQDLSWLTADDAGEATELGWRRLWCKVVEAESNAVHRCDRDCPPVGVAGAVPTGEIYQPSACVHCDGVGCSHCNYGGI